MDPIHRHLQQRLQERKTNHLFRTPGVLDPQKIDFISNDYLGLGRLAGLESAEISAHPGAGASRLVSGQFPELVELEAECAAFFGVPACVFFPGGYLANLAVLSCLLPREGTYLYDSHCHVSLKEGMRLSPARRVPFRHNDPDDLSRKLAKIQGPVVVVTEALFSMEGDLCPLEPIGEICRQYGAGLVLDEAHSTGILGESGKGLGFGYPETNHTFIRIHTFGKAPGCMGAVVTCPGVLRDYLVNFALPLIYSTAPSPVLVRLIRNQLQRVKDASAERMALSERIEFWNIQAEKTGWPLSRNERSPIQYVPVSGNETALSLAARLQQEGFQVKAMLSPTVPQGKERIRVCLHSFNKPSEIQAFIEALPDF